MSLDLIKSSKLIKQGAEAVCCLRTNTVLYAFFDLSLCLDTAWSLLANPSIFDPLFIMHVARLALVTK